MCQSFEVYIVGTKTLEVRVKEKTSTASLEWRSRLTLFGTVLMSLTAVRLWSDGNSCLHQSVHPQSLKLSLLLVCE